MTGKADAAPPVLVWFRNDLRLSDNPALHAAAATRQPLLCVHVFDEESPGIRPLGGAARWWLHHALADLSGRLASIGGRLDLLRGAAGPCVEHLAAQAGVSACFWNRRYAAGECQVDEALEQALRAKDVAVHSFNGSLLYEPAQVRSKQGTAFKVFTPFLRASLALGPPDHPLAAPRTVAAGPPLRGGVALASLGLLPTSPDWAGGLRDTWTPGEKAGQALLADFLDAGLPNYGEDRNRPAEPGTSRLSPYLRHGEISPRQVVAQARHAADAGKAKPAEVEKFVSEIVWRDFAYNLLTEHPDVAEVPIQPDYTRFPYKKPAPAALKAWQRGQTGYPIVDAGMRQLWTTGVMHNRVRMIAASFLIKHMLADWRLGERWFWDTLCDADPASNPVNWQWVAGCGADAAPYFRIFNPTLQGEKFDPEGAYVRRFVPELQGLAPPWIHRPWDAPRAVLDAAGVTLGTTYPQPIVEHEPARDRALKALAAMRASSGTARSDR